VTYLRPSAFASNAFGWRDSIRAGKVVDPTGDGVRAVTDPEDIARVAVAVLTEDGHVGKGVPPHRSGGPDLARAGRDHRRGDRAFDRLRGRYSARIRPVCYSARTPPEEAHLIERLNEVLRARRSVNITDSLALSA
jgi:hypothetical protein